VTIPHRGRTGHGTYFITANCEQKKRLLQSERMARLLIDVLYHYREEKRYSLHAWVVMPNHFHLLVTLGEDCTLERALQFIKGNFSFRVKRELNLAWNIWQSSFLDRRVRDPGEYYTFRDYIHQNPVKARHCEHPADWPYSSANEKFAVDEPPPGLKPRNRGGWPDLQA